MRHTQLTARAAAQVAVLSGLLALSTAIFADQGGNSQGNNSQGNSGKSGGYSVTNLVADQAGAAANQDTNLVNAWGIVAGPTTPMWVSDNGSGKSTVYDGTGALKLTVTVPAVSGGGSGVPTGIVFNLGASPTSTDFVVAGAG